MKHDISPKLPPTPTTTTPSTTTSNSQSKTPSRTRHSSKPKEPESINGTIVLSSSVNGYKGRTKSVPAHVQNNQNGITTRKKKPIIPSNNCQTTNMVDSELGSDKCDKLDDLKKEMVVVSRTGNRPGLAGSDPSARLRRRRSVSIVGGGHAVGGGGGKKRHDGNGEDPDQKVKELERNLEEKDDLVKELQKEILCLTQQLDAAQSLTVDLLLKNSQLSEDLVAAESKSAALSSSNNKNSEEKSVEDAQSNKFEDIKKFMALKLESSIMKKGPKNEGPIAGQPEGIPPSSVPLKPTTSETHSVYVPVTGPPSLPPPPPPPPPRKLPTRVTTGASTSQKSRGVVEFYNSLKKWEGNKQDSTRQLNQNKHIATSVHSSIVDEIQNRSAHLLAIKADIETKGDFINGLIEKVNSAAYTNVQDVVCFVNWLDNQLSSLADERAVLKHFKWPEKKADAMREAAVEYRDLNTLEREISLYKDDPSIPCGAALKKISNLLDKSERGIQRLIKLRSASMNSYQGYRIPTDWMLDSGLVCKIKQASMKLANVYMKRVATELQTLRHSDRESTQEALLLQGVHFAYRAHQFAGGLDSETMYAFEEIRQHVSSHLGSSRELFAGIPSS